MREMGWGVGKTGRLLLQGGIDAGDGSGGGSGGGGGGVAVVRWQWLVLVAAIKKK